MMNEKQTENRGRRPFRKIKICGIPVMALLALTAVVGAVLIVGYLHVTQTGTVVITSDTYGKMILTCANESGMSIPIEQASTFPVTFDTIKTGDHQWKSYTVTNTGDELKFISFSWDDSWFTTPEAPEYGFTYAPFDGVGGTGTPYPTIPQGETYGLQPGQHFNFKIGYNVAPDMIPAPVDVELTISIHNA